VPDYRYGIYSVFLAFSVDKYPKVCTNSLYYFIPEIHSYAILQRHNSFEEAKKFSQFY